MMPYYSRKPTRIPNFDYSQNYWYFVTVCTHNKKCIFGKPRACNDFGKILESHVKRVTEHFPGVIIDKYVVMPNHFHAIICLADGSPSLPQIVGLLKSGVTREIRQKYGQMEIWQRSFHDRIIRCQAEYEKIWCYIDQNPIRWVEDCFYSEGC